MNIVNDLVDLVAEAILDNIDEAANCSHRPEHVRYWLDANSRYLLASRIVDALGFDSTPSTNAGGSP